jgi:serine/threonine protein kinase
MPWALGEDSNIVNMAAFLEGRFRYPVNVPLSPELKHLINMMLVPDYNKRASLNDVIEHQWTNIGYNEVPRH